jgi:hypothetical protein
MEIKGTVGKIRMVVEVTTDVDSMDDGFNWTKYGQKYVKGNVFVRSYYKCSEQFCTVKKHVEQRGSKVVNTYEGIHSHLIPGLATGVRCILTLNIT